MDAFRYFIAKVNTICISTGTRGLCPVEPLHFLDEKSTTVENDKYRMMQYFN